MKIAMIDHFLNPGGGARIIRSLLPAMKKVQPDLDITFFGTAGGIKRERLDEVIIPCGIKIKTLSSTALKDRDYFKIKGSRFIVSLLQQKLERWSSLLPFYLSGDVRRELEFLIKGFDVAFFNWPFHLRCPKLDCPMVGVFQDFNYKYYFSSNVSTPWMTLSLNQNIPDLLAHFAPVVTSQFVADELEKFYPHYARDVKIVPIAPMSTKVDAEIIRKVLDKFKIKTPFILYPTSTSSHKNIGPLLAALPYVKKQGYNICIVLAGQGTDRIRGKACEQGIELCDEVQDVMGLGYVSNTEIDALIQSASIVVNCSLYEGNNGPALDAWSQGTPVAMSNIAPFVELLKTFDVRAAIFDPRSPQDIAEKIGDLLMHVDRTARDALHSKQAISQFTWDKCAQKYLNVFSELISSHKKHSSLRVC